MFEKTFIEQNRKLDELEERVLFQDNIINQLLITCDENEKHGRRICSQIHEIESKKITKNATLRYVTRCNNRNNLLHFSFNLRISIFSEAYI